MPEKRVQQQGRRQKQRAADNPVGLFCQAQAVAAPLPELEQSHAAAAKGAQQGQKLHGIGENVHGAPLHMDEAAKPVADFAAGLQNAPWAPDARAFV